MAERPNAGDYIAGIKQELPHIATDLDELAQAEVVPSVKHAGIGGGLFGGAATFALGALRGLLVVIALLFAQLFYHVAHREVITSLALGFGCMVVIALIIAGVLALIGKSQISKVKAPTATIEEAKASINTISTAVSAGVADAKSISSSTGRPAVGPGAWLNRRAEVAVTRRGPDFTDPAE